MGGLRRADAKWARLGEEKGNTGGEKGEVPKVGGGCGQKGYGTQICVRGVSVKERHERRVKAHLDRLIHRPRRNHINQHRRFPRRPSIGPIRRSVRSRTRCRCPSPAHRRNKVRVRLENLEASTRDKVPGSDRLVV